MKYFNSKNKLLIFICLLTMFNSLSVARAAEDSFTLLGAATLAPVKNINPNIYVTVKEENVILYSDSKKTSRNIKKLPKNYALSVLGAEYGWIYVQDDDSSKGYIQANKLTFKNGQKPDNLKPESLKAKEIVEYSKKFIGTPYVWGGTNLRTGVDCSGLIYSVYKDNGITLNRSSGEMYSNNGTPVEKTDLKEGDLVFFNTCGNGVSHVGMYIGNGLYIHSGNSGVCIADLYSSYSTRTYIGAKRIIA